MLTSRKSLTRSEIYEAAKEKIGLPYAESHRLLGDVFNIIGESLQSGRDVKISRFGVFAVRRKEARLGRNPKTNAPARIEARYSVSFRPSGILRERVQRGADGTADD
ncbi:MAG: integration host factor subunit alpha [Alphaproteobacteria bacterium]|nr:integration host factor subunit alpha [Alphaproteobacteria bacterium]MDA7983063.1 integration host factor subunit alpha [Alphaproteobacteria bacterium]MDA7984569.1 integration host factor subunit alpha [Alphaproteobacteria bacterium]MDA7987262.1 integration host factor subunit alpha [Alphaproteobacteria bacterium]MDA8001428.1 integration host factor subunit alpha [Alphaproteobacteria bacterium]